jgi:hypothetical protein
MDKATLERVLKEFTEFKSLSMEELDKQECAYQALYRIVPYKGEKPLKISIG